MFGASFGVIFQGLEIFRKSIDIRNRNILNANNPDYVQEDPVIKNLAPYGIALETIERVKGQKEKLKQRFQLHGLKFRHTV